MARRPRPSAAPQAAKIEDLRHPADVTRRNIPTAETQALMAEEEAAPTPMLYPRNPDLDPQLVWRGKDALDAAPLRVPTVPIYIQEKVLPAALIRDLKRVSKGCEPQADLFGGFDRIEDPEMRMEFYQHAENWSNRMILGDSLLVMNSLAEKEGLRGQVQCIYFDPPYGIRFASNWQPSTRTREVKEGRAEGVSLEPEVVAAFRDTWKDGIHSYLAYLRDRLVVARELLTESGSVFVQIGDENVHRVRAVMDEVFGSENAISTIVFAKSSGSTGEFIGRAFDYILWFARNRDFTKFRPLFSDKEYGGEGASGYNRYRADDGRILNITATDSSLPERILTLDNLTSQSLGRDKGPGAASWFEVRLGGKDFDPGQNGRWKTNQIGMGRLAMADRLAPAGNTLRYVRYLNDFRCVPIGPLWEDTTVAGFASRKRYVVETDPPVVERCMLMASDPGDLILDPTCGSGTTAFVAEQWGRRWIAIDTSRVALALARSRLMAERHQAYFLRDSDEGAKKEAEISGRSPTEGHFTNDVRQGFVLERVPHVTLKSIVSNAEIDIIHAKWQPQIEDALVALNAALKTAQEEWQVPRTLPDNAAAKAYAAHEAFWQARRERQKEIDASIARHADTEYLHDRPYTKRNTVRVTGPFTVESLSPHRVLPVGEDDAALLHAIEEETGEPIPPRHQLRIPDSQTDFATVVLENLRAAGVQNTRKNERLTFSTLKPWPGSAIISAEGDYEENGQRKRAAIVIGPEYGTVGADLVREAAREARDLFDTLVVCGFAFDPHVGEGTMALDRLTVLKARMNQELHAATVYKAGGGNLFVVFGEPDIALHADPDGSYRAEIRGVDIFDPTSGEVRSSGDVKQDIACWFIDTDYDGDSFFVRHAYFLGGKDPFERLKTALRAEIDEDAWATLYRTESRPFPRPKSGRIAVKVINHHGDEAMKVFRVG
jgi:adenine-specific DNA-methyltransferase